MARIGIFLIVVVLVMGMVGCAQPAQYNLTISTTEGGEIATPGDTISSYEEGTVVPIVAFPHAGYQFVNWTGDVDAVGDVNAGSTTITMKDDCSITANFEEIPADRPAITFAVAGPMTEFQGKHQWWGAELARDEINGGLGVNVGGVYHKIELVQVDTNESPGTPDEAVTALQSVINDVDFVLGGSNADSVAVYREVAMDGKRVFMNCDANAGSLQYSVVDDYDRYKYWFKSMPTNEVFLVGGSVFRMIAVVGGVLKDTLLSHGDAVAEDYRVPEDGKLRVALVMDEAPWGDRLVTAAQGWLPLAGFTCVGTWQVSATADDISAELTAVRAAKPHVIFCAFAGPVSIVYSKQKTELGIPAMTIGINEVEGQLESHWADTDGKCNGEIQLDLWAEGLQNTPKTAAFLDAFVAKTRQYPIYHAATYDTIHQLKEAIEAVSFAHDWSSITDVIDPANIDALIQYLETSSYTGAAGTNAYYPMPAINLGNGVHALSEAQVRALYPRLGTYNQNDWKCTVTALGGPHIAHDLVYGPGYQTSIGSQWQDGHKVGIWPIDFGRDSDAALTDKYGCWNFEYPGTVDVLIPIEGFLEQ